MKNTKLINLLNTFSPAEIKKFRDFTASPYFNKNKNVIRLCDEVIKFYPGFLSDKLNEEYLYSRIFGNEKYDYFRLKNIISDLYNLGLEFLKQQSNVYTSFSPDFNMITQLRSRKLWKYHTKFVESYIEKFRKTEIKDGFYLYNEYLLTTEKQLSNVLKKPTSIEIIQEEFNSFHDYTLLNILKFYALMLHISKENRAGIVLKMFDEVYSYINNETEFLNPTISIYKYIILLSVTRDTNYYSILKKQYFEKFRSLNFEDAYYAHMYIFGYCMDKFNIEADRNFINECYDLFKHAYENNMVSLGVLLYPDFINYVKVFMRNGDKKLSHEFMKRYKHNLPEEQAENCINFCNALILHREGDFKKSLALLLKVNFPLVILKVQVKILQLQLNYELGYYEETREQAEYFRKSLVNEKGLSDDYKSSILGFIQQVLKLIGLKEISDKTAQKEALSEFKRIIDKDQKNHFGIKFWLEDRLKEF